MTATSTVNFVPVPPIDTTTWTMKTLPTDMDISTPNSTRAIDVQLLDGTNAVKNQSVVVHAFDIASGKMDTLNGTTNDQGIATFNYTAPAVLPAGPLTITFEVEGGAPVLTATSTVNFELATYIITPDQNLTVTALGTTYPISVALTSQVPGKPSQPANGMKVIAEFLMPVNGILKEYEVEVKSGIATFEYISPDRNLPTSDVNVTFYYKDDHTIKGNTLLIFSPEAVDKVDKVYVVPDSIKITQGSEERNITIITVNAAHVGISATVTIEELYDGMDDYGTFTPSGTVKTDASGRINVLYKAPISISSINERNITITEISTGIQDTLDIKYEQATGPGVDYVISVKVPDSLSVDSIDQITVLIHERDNESSVIPDDRVLDVNLSSLFTNMLTFIGDSPTDNYNNSGRKPIAIETKTLSGSAVIEINALVYNGDSNILISTSVPVTILSGSVTAMSLTYGNTLPDDGSGQLQSIYTIHAVDRYNNPARKGIELHPSIINGTKVRSTETFNANGKINAVSPVTFDDTSNPFGEVDDSVDLLAIIPNVNKLDQLYLGNWSIDASLVGQLTLAEAYQGATVDNLNYVIGNSNRFISGYGIATADIKSPTGKYETDENGLATLIVTFDRILAGHTVTLSANAIDGNRTGVAKIEGLRWDDYKSTIVKIPNDGFDHNVTLALNISGIEPLVGLDISPSGIVSNVASCDINTSAVNDLYTDANGEIRVQISTDLDSSGFPECAITWSKNPGTILREY